MGVLTQGADRHRGPVRLGARRWRYLAEITASGEGFGKEIGLGSQAAVREVRPPRTVHDGQGPGIPGLRPARHPGHGPDLRHLQPRRLPPARLHGGVRSARHSDQDRPAGRPKARPGWSRPSRMPPRYSTPPASACSPASPGACPCRRKSRPPAKATGRWKNWTWSASVSGTWRRQFNLAAGFTKADDSLPPRLLTEAAKTGPAKGLVSGLAKMLPEYYELRGWDTEGRGPDDRR